MARCTYVRSKINLARTKLKMERQLRYSLMDRIKVPESVNSSRSVRNVKKKYKDAAQGTKVRLERDRRATINDESVREARQEANDQRVRTAEKHTYANVRATSISRQMSIKNQGRKTLT